MFKLIEAEPIEPGQPQPRSPYGRHRTSNEDVDEKVLLQRILLSEVRFENLQEGGEDEDFGEGNELRCKPEDWDYDTRIDLASLLAALPKGTDPKSAYLNLNRPREYDSLTIELILEKPRNKKDEEAKLSAAVHAWKIEHDKWKAKHASWVRKRNRIEIACSERALVRAKKKQWLNSEETRTIMHNLGHAHEDAVLNRVASSYAGRMKVPVKEAISVVQDYVFKHT